MDGPHAMTKAESTEFDNLKNQLQLTLESSQEAKTRLATIARKLSGYQKEIPKESMKDEPSSCFLHDMHVAKGKLDINLSEIHEFLNHLEGII